MRPLYGLLTFCLGVAAAIAVAACGSTRSASVIPVTVTDTVTTPPPSHTTSTPTTQQYTQSTPTATTPMTPTRTSTAPAFDGGTPSTATGATGNTPLAGAIATVNAHGYTPVSTASYDPANTLRVIVGTRSAHVQQAFFFVGDSYLGTDTSSPSGSISVVSQSDTEVTLSYAIYNSSDALCCSTGGTRNVTFALNNGQLQPSTAIPPLAARR